jgi:hypothetical protein
MMMLYHSHNTQKSLLECYRSEPDLQQRGEQFVMGFAIRGRFVRLLLHNGSGGSR